MLLETILNSSKFLIRINIINIKKFKINLK